MVGRIMGLSFVSRTTSLLAAGALVLIAGPAVAEDPEPELHGCVNKSTGVLRVVDAGQECRRF